MPDVKAGGRRQRQALETRRRIRTAATDLFLRQGYAATTMQQIAAAADVAWQTVYSVFGNKPTILAEIFDVTVAGDDEPVPIPQRPFVQEIAAAPDGRTKAAIFAAHLRATAHRSAAVQSVIESAAGTDPEMAALWHKLMGQLSAGMAMAARSFREQGVLRADLTVEKAADILWWYAGPWAYRGLVTTKGWSDDEYEAWLARTLNDQIFER
jgi:TetR/AcrR family transcriptional regulator of autoinduction and epiphytic fitness